MQNKIFLSILQDLDPEKELCVDIFDPNTNKLVDRTHEIGCSLNEENEFVLDVFTKAIFKQCVNQGSISDAKISVDRQLSQMNNYSYSELLDKLATISTSWKAQFHEPYNKYWSPERFGTPPDLPLEWTVDEDGMLSLDGIWLCPAKQVNYAKLDDGIFITPSTMELDLYDSCLTIIITKFVGEYRIAGVERMVYSRSKSNK